MNRVKIIFGDDNAELDQFTGYEIESDLLQFANAFSMTVVNNDGELAGVIGKGDPCRIEIDGETILRGYIDDVDYSTSDSGSTIDIAGRDLFGHLVDCSADLKTYRGLTLLQLARELTSAWDIVWDSDTETDVIRRVKVEPGESPLDILQRYADKEDLLIWLNADGTARIAKPDYLQPTFYQLFHFPKSNPDARLYNNVLTARAHESWREQYSQITVYGTSGNTRPNSGKGSRQKALSIALFDIDFALVPRARQKSIAKKARTVAKSANIKNRPLIIVDGDCKNRKKAQAKADKEKNRRDFDALTLTYTVPGHYGRKGKQKYLWGIDSLADIADELAGYTGQYYITRCRYSLDDDGPKTELEFHPKSVWLA